MGRPAGEDAKVEKSAVGCFTPSLVDCLLKLWTLSECGLYRRWRKGAAPAAVKHEWNRRPRQLLVDRSNFEGALLCTSVGDGGSDRLENRL